MTAFVLDNDVLALEGVVKKALKNGWNPPERKGLKYKNTFAQSYWKVLSFERIVFDVTFAKAVWKGHEKHVPYRLKPNEKYQKGSPDCVWGCRRCRSQCAKREYFTRPTGFFPCNDWRHHIEKLALMSSNSERLEYLLKFV